MDVCHNLKPTVDPHNTSKFKPCFGELNLTFSNMHIYIYIYILVTSMEIQGYWRGFTVFCLFILISKVVFL